MACLLFFFSFFFNDTATTEIYTLSLHDALPITSSAVCWLEVSMPSVITTTARRPSPWRSEEHTSELQSPVHLVFRLLLEKKKMQPLRSARREYSSQWYRWPCAAGRRGRPDRWLCSMIAAAASPRRGSCFARFSRAMLAKPPGSTLLPYAALFQ